jgi:hypothetical protein
VCSDDAAACKKLGRNGAAAAVASATFLPLGLGPGLVPNSYPKFHYAKKRFPITSKCRHMHGVLNIDEIKKLITQFCCTLRDEHFKPN